MTYTVLTFGDSNTHGTPPLASRDPHPRMKRRWLALDADVQDRHNGFQLLIICPPVAISSGTFATDFVGAKETSAALPPLYARIAQNRGLHFMNAGAHITSSPIDGVHFDEAAHETLGQAVADQVKTILT